MIIKHSLNCFQLDFVASFKSRLHAGCQILFSAGCNGKTNKINRELSEINVSLFVTFLILAVKKSEFFKILLFTFNLLQY